MPTALEVNAAGDFALIESGFIGHDDFTDPLLSKWTIDETSADGAITHSATDGGKVIFTGKGSYMRYTADPVSPTITLPSTTLQMAVLEEWGFDWDLYSEIGKRRFVLLGSGCPVAGPDTWGTGPWGVDGWGFTTINKVYFGVKETNGYWVQGSTAFTWWNPFGNVSSLGPGWIGTRVEPDGVAFGANCSGGSQNLQTAITVGDDWGGRHCTTVNYGLAGWPGLQTLSASTGLNSRCEVFEAYVWKQSSITIIGVPFDHDVEVEIYGGTPTSHPTYTLPARTLLYGPSQSVGIPDECGYTVVFDLYDAPTAPPRFQTLRVRERLSGPIVTEISPTVFQPGVFGGDIYTLCDFDLPTEPPEPPEPCPGYGECEGGISVTYADCDGGIPVTPPDCDNGISVTYTDCDEGIGPCPPEE
jgi:hypothetical protein